MLFFIVNNEIPVRFGGEQVTLGLNDQGEFALNPAQPVCQVWRDDRGCWMASPCGDTTVLLNQAALAQPQRLTLSDTIQCGAHQVEIRFSEADQTVACAIEEMQYHLLESLHGKVMNLLGNSPTELSPLEYKKRIEAALAQALAEVAIEASIEEYLSHQALRELLLDDIHGYGQKTPRRPALLQATECAPLLESLRQVMRVNPNETAAQKAARVDLLLPWAVQKRKVAIPASQRRTLAVGLLREQLYDTIFGLGPLEDLMTASDVNDIMVLPSGKIFLERSGQMQDSGRRMLSPLVAHEICQRIVGSVGRRLDQTSPMVDARLSDGSRLNAVIEPVSLYGPALTIRRFPQRRLTINDLIEKGSLNQTCADFLRACVIARKNIVVSGGTGSGKTTLLNTLAAFIPAHERIVTVEDTAEIQLAQEHVVTMQSRPPNLEGKAAIPIRELIRNSLRMSPNRIIVGECRGGEAFDMLQAMNTGHDGSLATLHASDPREALLRLEVMALEAEGIDLPSRALREIIGAAVNVIVQVSRLPHGARGVTSICEVVGFDETDGEVVIEEIFKLPRQRTGELAFSGYLPGFIDDLLAVEGVSFDALF